MRTPEEIEKATLTKGEAFKIVMGLSEKPLCGSGLVCDICPLNLTEYGLKDCTVLFLTKRLEALKIIVKTEMKVTCLICGETHDIEEFDINHKDVFENKNGFFYYKPCWVCIEAD